jgi:hypothetical protein
MLAMTQYLTWYYNTNFSASMLSHTRAAQDMVERMAIARIK